MHEPEAFLRPEPDDPFGVRSPTPRLGHRQQRVSGEGLGVLVVVGNHAESCLGKQREVAKRRRFKSGLGSKPNENISLGFVV